MAASGIHTYNPGKDGVCSGGWFNEQGHWIRCISSEARSMLHRLQPIKGDLMQLASYLSDRYFGHGALDWEPGANLQSLASTFICEDLGYDRVEWFMNESDDILLCMLWWAKPGGSGELEEGIIEFAGHDAQILSTFVLVESVEL